MRLGPKARLIGRLLLGATLVAGAAGAWQLSSALQDRTDDLTRHIRVDIWSTQQAEYHLHQFMLALARHVAGDEETGRSEVHRHLSAAQSAVHLLGSGDRLRELQLFGGVDEVIPAVLPALKKVGRLLVARGDARGDRILLARIGAELDPALQALHQVSADLAHIRIALQDQDLANVRRLISLNRAMFMAFLGVSLVFILVLLAEAHAARGAEGQARANEQRFKDFAGIASDWLWETDDALRFTYVSEQVERSTGRVAAHHLGKTPAELVCRSDSQRGFQQLATAMAERRSFRDATFEVALADLDEVSTVRVSGKPFFDDGGRFLGYRGVGTDVSDTVRREERIRFLAEYDQLTYLPNRNYFQDRLRECLDAARGEHRGIAIHLLDLDGFKEVNDSFGHDVGDALLVAVAERLRHHVRGVDILARLGGDEFAVIQARITDPSYDPRTLASRLGDALRPAFTVCGKELVIRTSIGVARFPTDGDLAEDLLKAADLALYTAKAQGRDGFQLFQPEMIAQLRRKKEIEIALRRAIAENELELYFQPQVRLSDGRLCGAEALLRWHHSEFGALSPAVFIPVAEESGLILPISQWVLETACREAMGWTGQGADAVVAVNVSPAQFMLQDLANEVRAVLERTGLPPSRLELEITEGLLMRDEQEAIEVLDRLQALGVRLAIDDFGTGYSSLSYLKRFPVHKVKIDKSFVRELERDRDDRMIVSAILTLGQALGLQTIAEGVETLAQREFLTSLGCDEAQGYLFGKAIPAPDFRQLCHHGDARASLGDPQAATQLLAS